MDATLIAPVLAAVIGAGPAFAKFASDRARAARNIRHLDAMKLQIELVESWLRVMKEALVDEEEEAERKEIAKARLHEIWNEYNDVSQAITAARDRGPDEVSLLRRTFLAYWPKNFAGWIIHTLFYILLAFFLLAALGSSISEPTNRPEWNTFVGNLERLAIAFVVFLIVLFPLQRLALWVDRR